MMVNAQADAQIQTVVIPAQARGNAKKRANAVDACKKHQPQETSKPEMQHRPPSTRTKVPALSSLARLHWQFSPDRSHGRGFFWEHVLQGNKMSTQQPEALRLADELTTPHMEVNREAAAELRRLHELCKEWERKAATWMASPEAAQRLDGYRELAQRLDACERQRDQLMGALNLALEYWSHRQQRYTNRSPAWVQDARAAIAKANGEQA
jgi:hypothetical protein